MADYLNPKDIVVQFLRKHLTDPRERSDIFGTDTFTAIANQKEFSLTPKTGNKVYTITSVTVNGTAQNIWEHFYLDEKDQELIFLTGLNAGDTVIVAYKEGSTNWIYPDKPNKKLSAISFPRMSIMVVTSPGSRLGNFEAPVETTLRFQVDIWTKEKAANQIFTINNKKYAGEGLADYLAYQVTQAFQDNEDELHPALFAYNPLQIPRDMPFNEEYQSHHKIIEFSLKGLNIGSIS